MAHPTPRWLRILVALPRLLLAEGTELVECVLRYWPGLTGLWLRRVYYRLRLKHMGRGVIISTGVRFFGPRFISVGDQTHIDMDCILLAGPPAPPASVEIRRVQNPYYMHGVGELVIGRGVHVAPGCLINALGGVQIGDFCGCTAGTRIFSITNHYCSFADRTRRVLFTARADPRTLIIGPVVMEDNTGLALNSVMLPGATLRTDSFVGIGSVVRDEIPPNMIAAGNPAKPLKPRFERPAPPIA